MDSKVGIVILNYNGWKDTIECLQSVLGSSYTNYKIVVVDNNSPNNSTDYIRSWLDGEIEADFVPENKKLAHTLCDNLIFPINYQFIPTENESIICDKGNSIITVIQSSQNNGFSAGNNIGIKFLLETEDCNYIWLLNNDTTVENNALEQLVINSEKNLKDGKRVGITGAKLRYYHSPNIVQACGGQYNPYLSTTKHVGVFAEDHGQFDCKKLNDMIDYPVGASMFVSTSFIKDVGYMCEDYFLYYEELDWTLRGKQKGWDIDFCWNSIVYHKEGGSIGANACSGEKSDLADKCYILNKVRFTKKFYSRHLLAVKFSLLVTLVNRLKRKQFDRAKYVFLALRGNV